MTQLMRTLAVVPPAAPPVATVDVLAALMSQLHESSLADQADRRAALEEARLARQAADDRADAAAAVRLAEHTRNEAERAHCRLDDIARRKHEAALRSARADEEQVRRAQGVAVTNTKLHADVQRSFSRAAVSESSKWCAHYADLCLVQRRLHISDVMLFQNVAVTLKGSLLVHWKAFVRANHTAVEEAADNDPFD